MCHSLVSRSTHMAHTNVTMTVPSKIKIQNRNFDAISLIDTGSDHCLASLSTIGNDYSLCSPCSNIIYGITKNPVVPIGEICATISFGNCYFKNVRILIIDIPIKFLIGKSLLFHDTIKNFTINATSIIFTRIINERTFNQTVTFIDNECELNVGTVTNIPRTIDDKIQWLAEKRSLELDTHENKDELLVIVDILIQYEDVFGYEGSALGCFIEPVRIPTMPGMAKAVRQHPIAKQFENIVQSEIDRLLRNGVIEPCNDPKGFNSPIIIVPKKSGKPRVCANFKNTLNKCLSSESDYWQMPNTETIFTKIGRGNKYFAQLDVQSGYWTCTIHEDDRHKTSFQWGSSVYQYIRLPMGLRCAGDIFCRAIAKALQRVKNKDSYESYIDDLLVYSKTFKTYTETIIMILEACRQSGIKLNATKCKFLIHEPKFLGRIINSEGYKPDPNYVSALLEMEPQKTKKQLQHMIGRFVWLRSYLEVQIGEKISSHCFSELMYSLNQLNRKDKKFVWTGNAQVAFELAKSRLTSPSVIYFADFSRTFILVTDASQIAVGAALLQNIDDRQKIIAVASKTLNPTMQRWSVTEKECYGILWACEKFEYFLRGPKPFLILTDHRSLIFLDRSIFANAKIGRWQNRLSEFNFVVQYIEGRDNGIADMLSRPFISNNTITPNEDLTKAEGKFYTVTDTAIRIYIPSWTLPKTLPKELLLKNTEDINSSVTLISTTVADVEQISPTISECLDIAKFQREEPTLQKIINYLQSDLEHGKWNFDNTDHRDKIYGRYKKLFRLDPYTNLLLISWTGKDCIIIPTRLRPFYIKQAHESGHFGVERVTEFLRHFWWPGKNGDVNNYVQSCPICARRKGNYGKNSKPNIGHLLRGSKPFSVIYIDYVHMPQSPDGKRYILTIIDSFSRFFYGYASSRDRGIDAARGLTQFMLEYAVPEVISSDRGTHFTNAIIEELCKSFHIKQNLHTAYRPQSSGMIERMHRTLKNAIWACSEDQNCSWTDCLPYVKRAMNMSKNAATGCSPYYAVFGTEPVVVGPVLPGTDNRSTEPLSYGMNIKQRLAKAHEMIKIANDEADKMLEERINPTFPAEDFETGDEVYLNRPVSAQAQGGKLPWIGPFTVLKSNGQIAKIDRQGSEEWVHRYHLVKKIRRRPELEVDPPPELFNLPVSESGRAEHEQTLGDSDPIENSNNNDRRGRTLTRTPRPQRTHKAPSRLSPRMFGKRHGSAPRLACKFK